VASIVEHAPDSKRAQTPAKRTKHIYHVCQDPLPVQTALCGHRSRPPSGGGGLLPRQLPPETCVVCIDLFPTCACCGGDA
jgi:hypothetical protein